MRRRAQVLPDLVDEKRRHRRRAGMRRWRRVSMRQGTGYDEATGLGSVDLYNLLTAWPATQLGQLAVSTTTVSISAATAAAA